MSESSMWKSLRPLMAGLDPVRIESPITEGVPDVNFTHGWIELKYAAKWPARGGPLRLPHFTKEQRAWLIARSAAGGRVYLLLKVGASEWLLFDGFTAAKAVGSLKKEELYTKVLARWTRKPKKEELQAWLRNW